MVANRAELIETCKTCGGIPYTPPPTPNPGTINFPGVLIIPCDDCDGKGERLTPTGKETKELLQNFI